MTNHGRKKMMGFREAILCLVLLIAVPAAALGAAAIHYFACNDCHRKITSPADLCLNCHDDLTGIPVHFSNDPVTDHVPVGTMLASERSDVMTAVPTNTGVLHRWDAPITEPRAGAVVPTGASLNSGYSRGRVTCGRCHDPHGNATNVSLVKIPNTEDELCLACHVQWNVANANANLTHPVGINYYNAAVLNDPTDSLHDDISATNAGSGDVRLVNGKVSCTSCHAVHYVDSDSSTLDGQVSYNAAILGTGDGKLLRSDGEARVGGARNTPVTGTAQLRSNLCQTCHKIELHGQGVAGDHRIGCLECHGGHSYNGGTPSAYILRDSTPGPVPTRPDGVNSVSDSVVTFFNFPAATPSRTTWADETEGTALGFCERCHGDVNGGNLKGKATEHEALNSNQCTTCHKHNDPANLYSFNRDATAATCGQCHGFPPYLNVPGDRVLVPANDGGYAENNSLTDPNTPYDYVTSTTHEKNEEQTGHKVHAGADLAISPAGGLAWYFVGNAGIDNCKVCHGPDAGSSVGGHRTAPATRPTTFRDLFFDGIAKTGGMSPSYSGAAPWNCSNVYCHTNGAPYVGGGRPTRDYTFTNVTPAWDQVNGGGYNSIHGNANRCQFCHGNNTTSMTAKSNSPTHQAHLGAITTLNMGKVFACTVCHANTAASPTDLQAGAMDGRIGGEHVNGLIDVDFETGSIPDTLPEALTGSTYTAATGVCSTYCHNVTGAGGAAVADWDVATDMQCDSCHGGIATDTSADGGLGPIGSNPISGSHDRHISTTGNGPKLKCIECHQTASGDPDLGTHAGHINGVVDIKLANDSVTFGVTTSSRCYECHGYDAEPGEIEPVWGIDTTTDCATCHSGPLCGDDINTFGPPALVNARLTGHNRSTPFVESGNPAASLDCDACHVTDSAFHWNGVPADDYMLRGVEVGFPATYAGSQNNFCGNCHGTAPAHPSPATVTTSINTHQLKLCVACHNVHGDTNIQMIWWDKTEQNNHDPSLTGEYGNTSVTFTNSSDFTAGNRYSYDEDDGAVGGAEEANSDDICATCHSTGAGTGHNNSNNSNVTHYQGQDCFTSCHTPHTDSTDAFKVGAGTYCNDCHGFPPDTVEGSTTAAEIGAHAVHNVRTTTLPAEDRTDCAVCHPGAEFYTLDQSDDKNNGSGGRENHGNGNRLNNLTTQIGYNSTTQACTGACHASADGAGDWTDTAAAGLVGDGLDCDACHYYSGTGTAISSSHAEHLAAGKVCTDCHQLTDGSAPSSGELTHVSPNPSTFTGGADDGAGFTNRATASLDEATVDFTGGVTSYNFDDDGADNIPGNADDNTCGSASPNGLGCHASGTPDWDIAIPATSAGCEMCHTDTTTSAVNPTSGLHGGPLTVTGNSHDGSFDNGAAGTADCVTCHTSAPSSAHADGTLDLSAPAITIAGSVGFTDGATPSCATTCHSAGATWSYLWSVTAKLATGAECANCHGDYASGWNAGVAPHSEIATRGSKHNSTGTLTYPCTDCHAIGSASGYNLTSKWDPTGVNSNHGDDKITMNQVAGTNTFATDTAPNPDRVGCTTATCHNQLPGGLTGDTSHTFRITTTAFTTQTVTGNEPSILCSSCHGGYTPGGTDANGYWPDGTLDEDTAGAHQKHLTALAQQVYSETLTQLLTNNTAGNPLLLSDEKQKELCSYCHNTPGADGDHGIVANLPAEVNGMFTMWTKSADNGVYSIAADTCATVDCHFNKTTPDNTYGWYDGNTSACVMCHVNVTADAAHTEHTGAQGTFGRPIGCADCHDLSDTDWVTNTPPASGHIDGTYEVAGGAVIDGVIATYDMGVTNSCDTNACHNAGNGTGAPAQGTYAWGTDANAGGDDCGLCHAASPTSSTHGQHVTSSYVSGCAACHTAAGNIAHIAGSVSYNTATITANGGATPNVTCTNTCHDGATAEFDGAPTIACTDCHSGTGATAYIGGDKTSVAGPNYMPQFNMHVLTPTVSGVVHDETVPGAGGDCAFCHDTLAGLGSHIDGAWNLDSGTNTDRGLFAAFSDASPQGTCTTSCHSAGTSWTYKWHADADDITGLQCAGCHGDYNNGWNAGVGHAATPGRGHTSAHNNIGDATDDCTACHVVGASTGQYPWTTTNDDWYPNLSELRTTLHGDGKITINDNSTTHQRYELPVGTWSSGCEGCHDGVSNDNVSNGGPELDANNNANHDFPVNLTAPSTPRWLLLPRTGDAASTGGGCDTCHGSGGDPTPGDTRAGYPDRSGAHAPHIAALSAKGITGTTACLYCHPYPDGESSYPTSGINKHNDDLSPATMPDPGAGTPTKFKRIIGGGDDTNGVTSQGATVTCSSVDCHFNNAVTPQWYTDTIKPDAAPLTAEAGPNPLSIRVYWNAPGDDGSVPETTPYVYDMRYSDVQATAADFGLTDNYVGGLPAAYAQGALSEVVVENLDPAKTYYFYLKTRDTAGNWSDPSWVLSPNPTADTLAPAFGGADKAVKGDEGAAINLYWTAAEDHSMPITYKIYMVVAGSGSGTNGALKMGDGTLGTDAPLTGLTAWTDTKIELDASNGVAVNTIYDLGVRACDAQGNCDDNNQVVSATPTEVPKVAKTYPTYRANAARIMSTAAYPGAQSSLLLAPSIDFIVGATYPKDTTVYADTFTVRLANSDRRNAQNLSLQLGYSTNGTTWAGAKALAAIPVTLGGNANRTVSFKILDLNGTPYAGGQSVAVRITDLGASGKVTASWGTTGDRGDLTVAEVIDNLPPAAGTNAGSAVLNGTIPAIVDISWDPYTDTADGVTDTVHYDLYGTANGITYVIAEGLDAGTTSYSWDTQTAGITGGALGVILNAGDTYDHTSTPITGFGSADPADHIPPNAIDDLTAKSRPKSGTVWLTWTAPGDDYGNHGRAKYYDIRVSTALITEGNFNSIVNTFNAQGQMLTGLATGEPTPDFGGETQNFEVTNLVPGTNYFFAIRTYDEAGNFSPISTPKYPGPTPPASDQALGGPRCGMCHTTAPSVTESVGNHKLHGFTINDCDKCHDDGVDPPSTYGLDHQDGILKMGYGAGKAHAAAIYDVTGKNLVYTHDGTPGGTVLYQDNDGGWGGFGDGSYTPVGALPADQVDSGTCINFGASGVSASGCHGPAGTDPDGGGALPTYPTPKWDATVTLACSNCHGNPLRTNNSYGRAFDGTVDNLGVVPDQILGAPTVDNHGNYLDDGSGSGGQRKYIGQHDKHLNYSFRFSKKDSCNLCHAGEYQIKAELDGKHANGEIDVQLDLVAAGDNATWIPGNATTPGSCSNLSDNSCHPKDVLAGGTAPTPMWDTNQSFDCYQCHGMGGAVPTHTTDRGPGFVDDLKGNCEWCHFGGHPRDDVAGTALVLLNNTQVGINYRSTGIHLKKTIGGRGPFQTEAELCWGCHDVPANGISEWGQDAAPLNTNTVSIYAKDPNYNYGTLSNNLSTSNWYNNVTPGAEIGATWTSANANFSYKTGPIQSTHSTHDTNGTNTVSGGFRARTEALDKVADIRCSHCHDVHDLAKAPGDTKAGAPFLRGSWIRNPYLEDGAPRGTPTYGTPNKFMNVPRGGSAHSEYGGFQIDQNNGNPTATYSLATSGGICTLCHSTVVDTMNKNTGETNWWVGTNGHSNAAIGGTGAAAVDIMNFAQRNPSLAPVVFVGSYVDGGNPSMGYTNSGDLSATNRADGFRSAYTGKGYGILPKVNGAYYAFTDFDWGVTQDTGTKDIGYHSFTCSKCHNPHASRLPKLMITNCLDTKQNTWDDAKIIPASGGGGSSASADNVGKQLSNAGSAQNCHRRGDETQPGPLTGGGWNTVTPW